MALMAALVLLLSLTGKRMFEAYEGPSQPNDRTGRKMAVVRWTIIVNLASVVALYFFVTVYLHAVGWHVLIPASLLLGLLAGVLLLGAEKSVGILIVALCCLSFVQKNACQKPQKQWGRWLGLAAGLAVLPWADSHRTSSASPWRRTIATSFGGNLPGYTPATHLPTFAELR